MAGTQAPDEGFATSSDGSRIAWKRYGTGDPVILFIPTWNIVDSRVVRAQVDFLAKRATVVTYDPRGAGASDRPAHGYDFPMHAADAVAVLDANDVSRAAISTASRGMNSAILLATSQPERVDRIVAVAPYVPLEPRKGGTFWTVDAIKKDADLSSAHGWRTHWPEFARYFMSRVFSEPDSEETISWMVNIALEASPELLITQERELNWAAIPPLLGSVAVPTLLIHGEADVTMPISMVRDLADALPDARLKLLPGGGHRPDIRTPERVNELAAAFLLG